jgi:hypothetical protein
MPTTVELLMLGLGIAVLSTGIVASRSLAYLQAYLPAIVLAYVAGTASIVWSLS